MQRHLGAAMRFMQDKLRTSTGEFVPNAPELLREFWLGHGLDGEFELSMGAILVRKLSLLENVS